MNETNASTSTPAPAPEAGDNQPQPNAAAASPTAPKTAPEPEKSARSPGEFNKELEADLTAAADICAAAQKPEYAPGLLRRGIAAPFVVALLADIASAGHKSESAVNCDSAATGATQGEAKAGQHLLASLRTIQSAARAQHLPENPEALEKYLIGERLADSRPILERTSSALLNNANAERPAGLDTHFIELVQTQRGQYVGFNQTQGAEESKSAGDRAQRDALVKSITARRKKIQYAADTEWPPHGLASAQARKAFQLPAKRPYSY